MEIRLLKSEEIECRIQSVTQKGACFLLYKNARVDQTILDEVFGAMNWTRTHQLIGDRLYCSVSIWDDNKRMWVTKQDVGTESKTEAEKGQASDSFKRACFNWGIGRELYSAPFIWINKIGDEDLTRLKLSVQSIGYDGRNINELVLVDKNGEVRYELKPTKKRKAKTKAEDNPADELTERINDVINAINNCKTRAELKSLWASNSDLQTDNNIMNAFIEMGKKFPKK